MKNLVDCASVPCRLPEEQAKEIDALVKTLPSECKYVRKASDAEYQFSPGERAEVSVLSSDTLDQSNEVVLPEGIALEAYRKSSVVLWNHDQSNLIGTCGWIKLHGNRILGKTIYPERPEGAESWFTDNVWSLIRCSPPILRSKSIGFLPTVPLRPATDTELQAHPDWKSAGIWQSGILLEYSCVYNGANTDAIVQAINTKSVDEAILKTLGIEVPVAKANEPPLHENCSCVTDADGWHTSGLPNVCEECKAAAAAWNASHKSVPCCAKLIDRILKSNRSDCVSKWIKKLHDEGKYTNDAQIAAIAYSKCSEKKRQKKMPDPAKVVEKAISRINLDEVMERAKRLHRNRGRV